MKEAGQGVRSAQREGVWEQLAVLHRGVCTNVSIVFSHVIPEVCDKFNGKNFKIAV